ncbi:hypothetical protein NDU88_005285 [Pleurodeles waltl]|uniref:Uncharacterized protein n=1 Tax=Pleurodeles waltl TaxID=8319 RepID=A0AAV7QKQ7_PLEWA|nr:hypothetical protein NDU88_005285 [Pleurodeles waltl]
MNASECKGGDRAGRFLAWPFGPRDRWDRWELHFPAATVNARLPLVALGPESSGSVSTFALARIHAGAPAQLGLLRVRLSTSRPSTLRGPPQHSITFMPAPRLCRCARHYGNHIEASNATRPAAVINFN